MTGRIKAGQASGGFHPDLGKTKRAGFRFSADWPEGSIKRALISFFSKDNISLLFSHGKFPDAFVKYRKISLISDDSDAAVPGHLAYPAAVSHCIADMNIAWSAFRAAGCQ